MGKRVLLHSCCGPCARHCLVALREGGYSVMLSSLWNLDLGLGAWGGWKKYTRYACPLCGLTLESGEKLFWLPDARIAIQLIF